MAPDTGPSYLRVTAWTLAVLVGVMLIVALFGGFEPSMIARR